MLYTYTIRFDDAVLNSDGPSGFDERNDCRRDVTSVWLFARKGGGSLENKFQKKSLENRMA